MRYLVIFLTTLILATMAICKDRAECSLPTTKIWDEVGICYSGRELLGWPQREVNGKSCRISPVIQAPKGYELNHFRVIVDFAGEGSVKVGVVHAGEGNFDKTLEKRKLRTGFKALKSGREVLISSPRRGKRFAWLAVHTMGSVRITDIRFVCWRAKGTLYGHLARQFEFDGATLPYRLMYPKNFDPAKTYPLVLSVHGSGGVGSDNSRSMERVILASRLFTQYYHDEELECFSLVPQIPRSDTIPAPYFPKGEMGKPTTGHPDWPMVNENGWYVQATLALIQKLLEPGFPG